MRSARDVDIYVASAALDRERFRMSRQVPALDDPQCLRIEDRQRLTVAHEELVRDGVEAQVVGVVEVGEGDGESIT